MTSGATPAITPDDLKTLEGHALRSLRTKVGLSQGRLEGRTGIDSKQISEYERGKVWPGAENLSKLLTGLGCSLEDFSAELRRQAGALAGPPTEERTPYDHDQPLGDKTEVREAQSGESHIHIIVSAPVSRVTALRGGSPEAMLGELLRTRRPGS